MPERRLAPRSAVAASLLAFVSVGVALWPYTGVIEERAWVTPIVFSAFVIVAIGTALRRVLARPRPWVRLTATLLLQLLVLTALLTWLFGRATARFGVLPTWDTADLVPVLLGQAVEAIWTGRAPVAPGEPLVFTVTAAFGLLAIALDQLLAHGRTVMASVVLAVVGAVPTIITAADVDLWWFALCAVMILLLLRHGIRRDAQAPRPSPRALAASVGVLAIAGAAYLGPSMPLQAAGVGPTQRVTLNPTLDLGEDLREPTSLDVITLATEARRAPYLRLATLSEFDGRVWETDRSDTLSLSQGFGSLTAPEDLETRSTSIRMQDVAGYWLPVPYPATTVFGLDDSWRTMPVNRTLISAVSSARDQDYTITSLIVEPTLEEMRADRAGGGPVLSSTRSLPDDLPESIAELAREVTADASSDYDRLIALQSFFRSQFRYSLDAPVEQGFDGSGAEAVGQFLEVRSGYCVHFAAAFALMARSLDMPSRIVVGFLPGTPTGERRGEETLYTVKSDQLHAWPEVHFEGWGWIAFEPTASLGSPTQFSSGAEREAEEGATPSAEATAPEATTGPLDIDRENPDAGDPGEDAGTASAPLVPILGILLALAVIALAPAAARLVRRGMRIARASRGDAGAAWTELEDTLLDLGFPLTDTETPRVRGQRMIARAGAREKEVDELVDAIERASYAPPGSRATRLHVPLRRAIRQLMQETSAKARRTALFLPRSLLWWRR